MKDTLPASSYLAELAIPVIIVFAAYGVIVAGASWVCVRTGSRRTAALQSMALVTGLVALWDYAFLLLYHWGPICGCPDGGMFSGFFILRFVHSPYIIEYIGMPMLPGVVFHLVGALGFVAAGFAAGRLHWVAAPWGMVFTIPYAIWRSAPMWYTVVGYEASPPTVREAIHLGWGSGLEAASLVAFAALLAARWKQSAHLWPNKPDAPNPAPPPRFHVEPHWRRVGDPER